MEARAQAILFGMGTSSKHGSQSLLAIPQTRQGRFTVSAPVAAQSLEPL